jgi:indolepyruvate ferredoxin oxidoreductase beta subunit
MSAERPICVLIGALGGQGGGVLAEWLVEAARLAGYPTQATSIPGVAQRTGATTYYFELFPERNPAGDPVFCLFPSAGDVDLVAALEPTEAGRALERGYVTDKTIVVTSTARVYSTAEKSIAGDGVIQATLILESLARAAKILMRLDLTNPFGREVNAVLFGAIIGSGLLPLTEAQGRAAIEARGLAVADNLTGFRAGLEAACNPIANPKLVYSRHPERSRAQSKDAIYQIEIHSKETFTVQPDTRYASPPPGFESELASFPESLRVLVGHALARLVDYQDRAYARHYLDRLQPILDADRAAHDFRLTAQFARRLAAWMSAEDVIRVAQLKTRPGRLARIREEVSARPGEPVEIVDFLSPSRMEVLGMLPPAIARRLSGGRAMNSSRSQGLTLAWPTSSPWGYAALKLLAALKPIRPRTSAFAHEQQAIETWLDAVKRAAQVDYDLACQVAELAIWARGYGAVRARGLARLARLFADWPRRLAGDIKTVKQEVKGSLFAARNDPDACL